jgi:hypothetical protein
MSGTRVEYVRDLVVEIRNLLKKLEFITTSYAPGSATEVTLQAVENNTDGIEALLTSIQTLLGFDTDTGVAGATTLRTIEATRDTSHTFASSSTTGNATGFKSISILNTGSAAGTVNGIAFPTGASLTLPFNPNGTYSSTITWNATGTTFLISIIN